MAKPEAIQKILVINLAFLGDVILSTPVVRALKRVYPMADIHMLVTPATREIAEGNPYCDKVIVYDKRGKDQNLIALWRLISHLRQEKYDLAVSMNFALRGALVAWAAGARLRLGYDAQHAAMFLTHIARADRSVPQAEAANHLALLKPLGIIDNDITLEYRVDQAATEAVVGKLTRTPGRPLVVICPYGRHPLNSWTQEGYIALLRRLAQVADCFLIGGQAEKPALDDLNSTADSVATVLAGVLSISQLAALLKLADLVITVDTGPLHIAAAVGTPVLGIFGRSDYRIWGPHGPYDRVLCKEPACWPCYRRECDHHSCMKQIGPDEVITTALEMLAARKAE
jgi:lipopolysaccharide heptosyltransferase II